MSERRAYVSATNVTRRNTVLPCMACMSCMLAPSQTNCRARIIGNWDSVTLFSYILCFKVDDRLFYHLKGKVSFDCFLFCFRRIYNHGKVDRLFFADMQCTPFNPRQQNVCSAYFCPIAATR